MIISLYLQKNGEDDYLNDDPDYVVTDVPKKYIVDNDENDDGYDVGIDDEDDGSHWRYYWDCGFFFVIIQVHITFWVILICMVDSCWHIKFDYWWSF